MEDTSYPHQGMKKKTSLQTDIKRIIREYYKQLYVHEINDY